MLVLDALFDHIQQISSHVEIIGAWSSARPCRQVMSELGQTEKNSLRENVFRVTPESEHCSMQSACLTGAGGGNAARELERAVASKTLTIQWAMAFLLPDALLGGMAQCHLSTAMPSEPSSVHDRALQDGRREQRGLGARR